MNTNTVLMKLVVLNQQQFEMHSYIENDASILERESKLKKTERRLGKLRENLGDNWWETANQRCYWVSSSSLH